MERLIRSYSELGRWAKSFVDGKLGLMFLIGPPGVGKTFTIQELMDKKAEQAKKAAARKVLARKPRKPKRARAWDPKKDGDKPPYDHKAEPLWLRGGTLSAFMLYQKMYEHLHEPVVVDDVDEIYKNPSCVQLLKAVTQTEDVKTVGWNTATRQLDKMGIPPKFRTTSKVCIIANRWKALSEHVGSLESRGVTVYFDPSPRETYDYLVRKKIIKDGAVLTLVKQYLHLLRRLDIRDLKQAEKLKAAKLPWQDTLLDSLKVRELSLLEKLEKDPRMKDAWGNVSTDLVRAAFIRQTGRSAADFAEFRKILAERLKLNAKPRKERAHASPKRGR